MGVVLSILQNALQLGLIFSILGLGVFISYRILDCADLSVEGTFPFGAIISAVLIKTCHMDPALSILVCFFAGVGCGLITAFLNTICRIPVLLSGIIVMTGLYSVTLMISKGSANIALSVLNANTIFSKVSSWTGLSIPWSTIILTGIIVTLIAVGLYWFFGTELGIALRATGRNQRMAKASGINTNLMIFIGLGLSNGLVAVSGAIFAQHVGYGDIGMGRGTIVIGLAAIILGEAVFGKRSFKNQLISVVLGSIVYYLIIRIAMQLGINTNNLKLLYSAIIVIILVAPYIKPQVIKLYSAYNKKRLNNPVFKEKYLKKQEKRKQKLALMADKKIKKEEKVSLHETETLNKRLDDAKFKHKYEKEMNELNSTSLSFEDSSVQVNNIVKSFNVNGQNKTILKGININIKPGDFITVIGGNGSGKTTFLNCLSGMYKVDSGSITMGYVDLTNLSENKRAKYISRVFQDPNLGTCSDMSIEQNMVISYNRGRHNTFKWGQNYIKRSFFKEHLKDLNLNLENRLQAKANELSGGQRQALTLIMSNLKKPNLLLLDEHCAALDPKTAQTVMETTEKIVKENKITTLMVTHNMKDAIKYGNRLIMLNNGQIIFDVEGEEKAKLTIDDLLKKFQEKDTFEYDDTLILG